MPDDEVSFRVGGGPGRTLTPWGEGAVVVTREAVTRKVFVRGKR